MATQNTTATASDYQAHDSDTLHSEVRAVKCVLLPGSLTTIGYDEAGLVLAIRHQAYEKEDRTEWMPGFFEHQFLNEPLLAMPQQVKALFIGSCQQLIVPDALYDAAEAGRWLQSMYLLHPEDSVPASLAKSEAAHYLLSMPVKMQALLHKYFPEANVLPLAAYQLTKPRDTGSVLRCLIDRDQVMATLYLNGQLRWHQVFSWETIADIAWQFATLGKDQGIAHIDLHIEVTTLTEALYDEVLELETYFPKINWTGKGAAVQGAWGPVLNLAQQLYQCAL